MVREERWGILKAHLQVKRQPQILCVNRFPQPLVHLILSSKCWGSFRWNISRLRAQALNPLAGIVVEQPIVLVSLSVDPNLWYKSETKPKISLKAIQISVHMLYVKCVLISCHVFCSFVILLIVRLRQAYRAAPQQHVPEFALKSVGECSQDRSINTGQSILRIRSNFGIWW